MERSEGSDSLEIKDHSLSGLPMADEGRVVAALCMARVDDDATERVLVVCSGKRN